MKNKKRLYIGLLTASLAIVAGLFVGISFLFRNQNNPIFHNITITLGVIFLTIFTIATLGTLVMIISIMREENIRSLQGTVRFATALLFPLAVQIGRLIGIAREKVWASYVEVNNYLVRTSQNRFKGEKLVILAPHCLQSSDCPHKITVDVNNCQRCGICNISDLIDIAERYGAVLKIATGGTLARKVLREARPQGVVAIACERDLSLGIQDSNPLPVIGVLNERPHGPCQDTEVDLASVEEALRTMTQPKPAFNPRKPAVSGG